MINMKIIFAFICAVLFISACTKKNSYEKLISINANLKNVPEKALSDFFDLEIIILERKDNSLIGKISKVIFIDSTLYILDRDITRKVYVYNLDGGHVRTIGEIGKGKGEYIRIKDICIFDGFLYLLAGPDKKIIKYDLEGNYITETRLNKHGGYFLALLDDNKFLSLIQGSKQYISFWNDKGKEVANYHLPKFDILSSITEKPVSVLSDEVYVHLSYIDTIYKVSDNNQLLPCYVFDYFAESFPINRIINKEDFNNEKITLKYIILTGFVNSKTYIFTEFIRNKRKNYGYYDKEQNKYYYIPRQYFKQIPVSNLVGEYEDGIILSTPAWVVKEMYSRNKINNDELVKVGHMDNPILFLLKQDKK